MQYAPHHAGRNDWGVSVGVCNTPLHAGVVGAMSGINRFIVFFAVVKNKQPYLVEYIHAINKNIA
jgi:hypothetical protein